jgi:hypothetical protein
MINATHTHPATNETPRKPLKFVGMSPATDVASYQSVPWYRRGGFAFFPLFAPVLILAALTGDIFQKPSASMRAYSDAEVWRYGRAARAWFVLAAVAACVFWTVVITRW